MLSEEIGTNKTITFFMNHKSKLRVFGNPFMIHPRLNLSQYGKFHRVY